jgi:hypothetical protein
VDCTGDGYLCRLEARLLSGSETDEERGVEDCEVDGDQEVIDEALVPCDFSLPFPRELASLRRDIVFHENRVVAPGL